LSFPNAYIYDPSTFIPLVFLEQSYGWDCLEDEGLLRKAQDQGGQTSQWSKTLQE